MFGTKFFVAVGGTRDVWPTASSRETHSHRRPETRIEEGRTVPENRNRTHAPYVTPPSRTMDFSILVEAGGSRGE